MSIIPYRLSCMQAILMQIAVITDLFKLVTSLSVIVQCE